MAWHTSLYAVSILAGTLDSDYAARILLGALTLSMTMDRFGSAQRREAQRPLSRMRRAPRRKILD